MTPLADLRFVPALHAGVLALNAAHEVETAPMDAARLARLLACACAAPAAADGTAFAVAMDETAAHDGAHFGWFRARLDAFVYVDRVIVARERRGAGLAAALYAPILARARARGVPAVCEVNAAPPNPASARFHARLGFAEIGRGTAAGGKRVAYLARP